LETNDGGIFEKEKRIQNRFSDKFILKTDGG